MVSDNSSAGGMTNDKGKQKFNLSKNDALEEVKTGDKFNLSKSKVGQNNQGLTTPMDSSNDSATSSRQSGGTGFNLKKSGSVEVAEINQSGIRPVVANPETMDIKKSAEKVEEKKEEKVSSGSAKPDKIDLKKPVEKQVGGKDKNAPPEEKNKSKIIYWVLGAVAVVVLVLLLMPGKERGTDTGKPGGLASSGTTNKEANTDPAGNQKSGEPTQSTTPEDTKAVSAGGGDKVENSSGQMNNPDAKSGENSGTNQSNTVDKSGNPSQTTNPKTTGSLPATAPRGKVVYNFGYNHAAIVFQNKELNDLVDQLKKNPSSKLTIVGYTDNTGLEKYNQILSEQRALALYYYLLNNGIAANRMKTSGMADKNPLFDNSTEEGRNGNRRVEFIVE